MSCTLHHQHRHRISTRVSRTETRTRQGPLPENEMRQGAPLRQQRGHRQRVFGDNRILLRKVPGPQRLPHAKRCLWATGYHMENRVVRLFQVNRSQGIGFLLSVILRDKLRSVLVKSPFENCLASTSNQLQNEADIMHRADDRTGHFSRAYEMRHVGARK